MKGRSDLDEVEIGSPWGRDRISMKGRSDHQKSRLDLDEREIGSPKIEIGSRWGGDWGARVGYGVGVGAMAFWMSARLVPKGGGSA
jgi:hypothetical protein